MKKILLPIVTAALLITSISCEDAKKENTKTETTAAIVEKEPAKINGYSYNNDSTQVKWTAYKTTDKKGVNGHFTAFTISGTEQGDTPQNVFKNASFVIQTNSVNTGMELRDNRIINNFFKVFVNTSTITGKIKSINEKNAVLEISLNEITKDVPVKVISNGNNFSLDGTIDLGLFNGQPAVDSLNYVCKDVHKGSDGITKLWPDVAISVSTVLTVK
jgi:polyisoprenoid-binding protein YceI